jgi:hypothetical protein
MAKKKEQLEQADPTGTPTAYEVVKGFNYGPEDVRVTPGPLTVELPAGVFDYLIEAGAIVEVSSGS